MDAAFGQPGREVGAGEGAVAVFVDRDCGGERGEAGQGLDVAGSEREHPFRLDVQDAHDRQAGGHAAFDQGVLRLEAGLELAGVEIRTMAKRLLGVDHQERGSILRSRLRIGHGNLLVLNKD